MQFVFLLILSLLGRFVPLHANNDSSGDRGDTSEINTKYRRYYEPFFKVYYDLDDDPKDTIKTLLKQGLAYEGNIGLILTI